MKKEEAKNQNHDLETWSRTGIMTSIMTMNWNMTEEQYRSVYIPIEPIMIGDDHLVEHLHIIVRKVSANSVCCYIYNMDP